MKGIKSKQLKLLDFLWEIKMRIVLAGLLAFALVYVQGPVLIPTLHRMKFGQFERELGPASHKKKQGTPTMGGIMMLIAIAVSSLLLAD